MVVKELGWLKMVLSKPLTHIEVFDDRHRTDRKCRRGVGVTKSVFDGFSTDHCPRSTITHYLSVSSCFACLKGVG